MLKFPFLALTALVSQAALATTTQTPVYPSSQSPSGSLNSSDSKDDMRRVDEALAYLEQKNGFNAAPLTKLERKPTVAKVAPLPVLETGQRPTGETDRGFRELKIPAKSRASMDSLEAMGEPGFTDQDIAEMKQVIARYDAVAESAKLQKATPPKDLQQVEALDRRPAVLPFETSRESLTYAGTSAGETPVRMFPDPARQDLGSAAL